MLNLKNLPLFFLLLTFLVSCTPSSEDQKTSEDEAFTLQGSWDLKSYIPHDQGKTSWESYGDSILYQKHLTEDHFTWIKFDTKNEKLMGMGGGTYSIETGQYVENIKFFYPPGSSELGQAIPFEYEVSDGIWYHTGYAKNMEMDMETGEIVVIDSSRIEEKWARTKLEPNTNKTLQRTWKLVSYLDQNEQDVMEYPDFISYIKLITPTHFAWVYFNEEGDEIYASGSGTYDYSDDIYTENIEMMYPDNSGQIGASVSFTSEISDKKWTHAGYIPNYAVDSTSGTIVKDSIYINEIWAAHSRHAE